MNQQPKIKVIVTAPVLRQIFADNPQVELELVKNATIQVANLMEQRLGRPGAVADRYASEIKAQLQSRFSMPESAKVIIRDVAREAADDALMNKITNLIQGQIAKIVEAHTKAIEKRLNDTITKIAEERVQALLVSMSRMSR